MAASYIAAIGAVTQGLNGMFTNMNMAKQTKYNAQANSKSIDIQIYNQTQARQVNARTEFERDRRHLAQIENNFARSGVEMSGDIVNYLSGIRAVQEVDMQQLNQDNQYQISVLRVEQENLERQARMESKGYKLAAITSLLGGGMQAYGQVAELKGFGTRKTATISNPIQNPMYNKSLPRN